MTVTTRRQFLVRAVRVGAGGAIALAVQPLGCGPAGVTTIDVSQVLTNPNDIVEIGREYVAQFPDESSRETLDAALADLTLEGGLPIAVVSLLAGAGDRRDDPVGRDLADPVSAKIGDVEVAVPIDVDR